MDSKKKFVFVFLLTTFLFGFAFNEFFYQPYRKEISNIQVETRKLQNDEKILSEFKSRHKNLEEFAETVEENLESTKNFMPKDLQPDNFVNELYKFADEDDVKIISVQVENFANENKESADNVKLQNVELKLSADYISLLNFIRKILDGGRMTRLASYEIEKVESEKNLACELNFVIYSAE